MRRVNSHFKLVFKLLYACLQYLLIDLFIVMFVENCLLKICNCIIVSYRIDNIDAKVTGLFILFIYHLRVFELSIILYIILVSKLYYIHYKTCIVIHACTNTTLTSYLEGNAANRLREICHQSSLW